jgi:hypothetical protein
MLRGSCGRHYIALTESLDRWLVEHHRGKVHSTHRFGQPLELVATKEMPHLFLLLPVSLTQAIVKRSVSEQESDRVFGPFISSAATA